MTATPDLIPTDLTLEIGDDISPERFLAAVRAFFGYVKEISETTSKTDTDIHHNIGILETFDDGLLAQSGKIGAPALTIRKPVAPPQGELEFGKP